MERSSRFAGSLAAPAISGSRTGWMAIYTKCNHERAVARSLADRSLEVFLPTYKEVREWSDRKKHVELPLFANYLFARIPRERRIEVVRCPGVVGIVANGSDHAIVSEGEIFRIRRIVESGLEVQPSALMQSGERVILDRGPLRGLEGFFVEESGQGRLVVTVGLLERALRVDVDRSWVRPAESDFSQNLQAVAEQLDRKASAGSARQWDTTPSRSSEGQAGPVNMLPHSA